MARNNTAARLGIAVGTAALAAVAVLACRQIVGIGDAPPGVSTSACGLPCDSPSCASCVSAHCCDQASACTADPVCSGYASCLARCNGDAACRSRCTLDDPVGRSAAFSAISACMVASCDNECGLGCGALGQVLSMPDAAASCEACLVTNACSDERACASSVDCDAYQRCLLTCPQYDCNEACAREHDAGSALYGPFATDFMGCTRECGFGHDWGCVGHVSLPAAKTPTTELHVRVVEYFSKNPIQGVTVSACAAMDDTCAQTVVPAKETDSNGYATLSGVPLMPSNTVTSGYSGYLLLTPPPAADGGSSSFVPALYFFGFPITEPEYDMTGDRGVNPEIASGAIPLVKTSDAHQALPALFGATQESSLGLIAVYVSDCLTFAAPHVKVTIDSPTDAGLEVRYLGSQENATGPLGVAAIFNVPPGPVTLTATPLDVGTASATTSVFVKAGAGTFAIMATSQ